MSTVGSILKYVLGTLIVLGTLSCGGATNNDQGTSFLALGFFIDGSGEGEGDAGTIVYLNEDTAFRLPTQPIPLFVPVDKDPEEEGLQGGFIGLENRLTSQFIRTVGAECSYEVPGADPSLIIPNDTWYFTTVLDPAPAAGEDEGDEATNQAFVQILIASPSMISFLSVNQNSLPELPFNALVTCVVTGVTQAGDTLETNPVHYQIVFAELPECCSGLDIAGPGFQSGPGTGGSFNSFGDSSSGDDDGTSSSSGGTTGSITESGGTTGEVSTETE